MRRNLLLLAGLLGVASGAGAVLPPRLPNPKPPAPPSPPRAPEQMKVDRRLTTGLREAERARAEDRGRLKKEARHEHLMATCEAYRKADERRQRKRAKRIRDAGGSP